jgi:hypothetical protein
VTDVVNGVKHDRSENDDNERGEGGGGVESAATKFIESLGEN